MRKTDSGIFIPGSVASVRVPKFTCTLCGKKFHEDEYKSFERHAVRCSNDREAEINAMSPRTKAPAIFDPEHESEAELTEWMQRNKDAVNEGRKKP